LTRRRNRTPRAGTRSTPCSHRDLRPNRKTTPPSLEAVDERSCAVKLSSSGSARAHVLPTTACSAFRESSHGAARVQEVPRSDFAVTASQTRSSLPAQLRSTGLQRSLVFNEGAGDVRRRWVRCVR
jgi:hypothetical protein